MAAMVAVSGGPGATSSGGYAGTTHNVDLPGDDEAFAGVGAFYGAFVDDALAAAGVCVLGGGDPFQPGHVVHVKVAQGSQPEAVADVPGDACAGVDLASGGAHADAAGGTGALVDEAGLGWTVTGHRLHVDATPAGPASGQPAARAEASLQAHPLAGNHQAHVQAGSGADHGGPAVHGCAWGLLEPPAPLGPSPFAAGYGQPCRP